MFPQSSLRLAVYSTKTIAQVCRVDQARVLHDGSASRGIAAAGKPKRLIQLSNTIQWNGDTQKFFGKDNQAVHVPCNQRVIARRKWYCFLIVRYEKSPNET